MHGQTIRVGSRWIYVGPDGTAGTRHTVIYVCGGVTTWSDPVKVNPAASDDDGIAGFSWYGPSIEFLRCFKQELTPPGQAQVSPYPV
jgi:hypothetical protein